MRIWSVQEAAARFEELLAACLVGGPQIVAERGSEVAVLVAAGEWRRLQRAGNPSLKELLLNPPRGPLPVPARGRRRRRRPDAGQG